MCDFLSFIVVDRNDKFLIFSNGGFDSHGPIYSLVKSELKCDLERLTYYECEWTHSNYRISVRCKNKDEQAARIEEIQNYLLSTFEAKENLEAYLVCQSIIRNDFSFMDNAHNFTFPKNLPRKNYVLSYAYVCKFILGRSYPFKYKKLLTDITTTILEKLDLVEDEKQFNEFIASINQINLKLRSVYLKSDGNLAEMISRSLLYRLFYYTTRSVLLCLSFSSPSMKDKKGNKIENMILANELTQEIQKYAYLIFCKFGLFDERFVPECISKELSEFVP